jgi:hypothetical protein
MLAFVRFSFFTATLNGFAHYRRANPYLSDDLDRHLVTDNLPYVLTKKAGMSLVSFIRATNQHEPAEVLHCDLQREGKTRADNI